MEFFFVALCYLAILMGVMCAVTWWLEEGRYSFRAKQRRIKKARKAAWNRTLKQQETSK